MKSKSGKKIIIISIFVAVVVLLVVVGGFLLTRNQKNDTVSEPVSISTDQALALPRDSQCLINAAAIKTKAQAQKGLGEEDGLWTSHIYDVPAGTNVNVSIATYNGSDTVTGSLEYSNGYGSYNFTVTKKVDDWVYTRFIGCK